ncbi:MAG TPA: hypothetical protein VH206_21860 [Xanthobacteraceae bacterium]|nr:hypothetical protein [Xanthobacteraceae bacterium]
MRLIKSRRASIPDGSLKHFDWLGYVVVGTTLLSLYLMYLIQRAVAQVAR